MEDKQVTTDEVGRFWSKHPVASNFFEYEGTREYYERFDEFRYTTESHIPEELDRIGFHGKKTLEIGLGQGADSMQIAQRGALYHGIDLTEESVRRVKERFAIFNVPHENVSVCDARNIEYEDDMYDIVFTHGVIHHSPDIERVVDELYRVLKPGGKAVVMLYHKHSFNYYVSIALIRRVGLLMLFLFPFLAKPVSRLTGEDVSRINQHKANFRKEGWSYLRMENFIHKSTDGPENAFSSVWTKEASRRLFHRFQNIRFKVHFLNRRHLLGLQALVPDSLIERLGHKMGWHLWIFAEK